jgi:hypothetical protein
VSPTAHFDSATASVGREIHTVREAVRKAVNSVEYDDTFKKEHHSSVLIPQQPVTYFRCFVASMLGQSTRMVPTGNEKRTHRFHCSPISTNSEPKDFGGTDGQEC